VHGLRSTHAREDRTQKGSNNNNKNDTVFLLTMRISVRGQVSAKVAFDRRRAVPGCYSAKEGISVDGRRECMGSLSFERCFAHETPRISPDEWFNSTLVA